MNKSFREEIISLSLFGGRLALADLILFSVFLTYILLLSIMGKNNLSGMLLANAAFLLCHFTALGSFRVRCHLPRSGSRLVIAAGITPSLRCRCCLAAGWRCWYC